MQYQTPQSEEDVDEWVKRTSAFKFKEQRQGFETLREKILDKKRGREADNVFLFSQAVVEPENFLRVRKLQLMIYVDHLITDGIGARILLGRYLSYLASSISTSFQFKLNWQENHDRLSPPWICLTNPKQELSGTHYEKYALWNQDMMINHMKNNHGIPLLRMGREGPETHEAHFITLTEAQSIALLQEVKKLADSDSNITHLGHAAMVLALLRSSPLLPPNTTAKPIPLYSPCWLNGRRYLLTAVGHPDPPSNYIPLCISFAPIIFADLRELSLSSEAGKEEIKFQLAKACRIATEWYKKIRERKSMLLECVVLFENLAENMREPRENSMPTEGEQGTSPGSEVEPTSTEIAKQGISGNNAVEQDTSPKYEVEKGTSPMSEFEQISAERAEPFFLSDGIIEKYIDREYFQTSWVNRAKTDKLLFEVVDVKFAANADRNVIVRMSNWRDRITLQAEWRSSDYDRSMIDGFLEDVKKIMLSIIE